MRAKRRWLAALGVSDYARAGTKRGVAALYRTVLAPVGRRRVRRLNQEGLPPVLSAPVAYLFDEGVASPEDRAASESIEELRAGLARLGGTFSPVSATGGHRPALGAAHLATVSAVPRRWGVFLRLCARHAGARTILELGSSTGISGCYLSSVQCCKTFVTIEGSPELAALARKHLAQISSGARVVEGLLEDVLEPTLDGLAGPLDLAFVDGPKTQAKLIAALDLLLPRMSQEGLVVFDDVRWSREMWGAWQAITRRPGIGYGLCVGRFGVVWLKETCNEARTEDLSLYLGWLGKGW